MDCGNMRIAMIVAHDPAGAMIQLCRALNEYTEHECRLIRMIDLVLWQFDFDLDVRIPEHREEIAKVLKEADILHFTNCNPGTWGGYSERYGGVLPTVTFPDAKFGLQELPDWKPYLDGKRVVVHFHGDMELRKNPTPYRDYFTKHPDCKVAVSTPDLLKCLPDATWIPNIIPIDDPLYKGEPLPDDFVRIYTTCRNYNFKGAEEFNRASTYLAYNYDNVIFKAFSYLPHKECLKARQSGDIFFDGMRLNAYGMASLEAMSQGQVTLCGLDDFFQMKFYEKFGVGDPFYNVTTEREIYETLEYYAECPRGLDADQRETRGFMERHMRPEELVKNLEGLYEFR